MPEGLKKTFAPSDIFWPLRSPERVSFLVKRSRWWGRERGSLLCGGTYHAKLPAPRVQATPLALFHYC